MKKNNISQIKPTMNRIVESINNKIVTDQAIDLFNIKDSIQLLNDPDDQKIALKNVLETLTGNDNQPSPICSINRVGFFILTSNEYKLKATITGNVQGAHNEFKNWIQYLLDCSNNQNDLLLYNLQLACLFNKNELYQMCQNMEFDATEIFASTQRHLKMAETHPYNCFSNNSNNQIKIDQTEYILDLNHNLNMILNNKNWLSGIEAVYLLAFPEIKSWNEQQKQTILSQVTYDTNQSEFHEVGNLSFPLFILKYNRTNGTDLSSKQIKPILFKTFKTHGLRLKRNSINSIVLFNDSQDLNLENRDIIELTNLDRNILSCSQIRQELIHNSLKVNNTECACYFIQKQSDLDLKDNKGWTILDIAIERNNSQFLKYCVDQQWITQSCYKQCIDAHYFNTNKVFDNGVSDHNFLDNLIEHILAFNQSPYQTSEQLLNQLENNDITKTDFKNFIASINSNSLKNEIIKSLLNDRFNNLMFNELKNELYFDLYDIANCMTWLDLELVYCFIDGLSPLSGQQRNQLINKLDSVDFNYLIYHTFNVYSFYKNYTKQNMDEFIQIVFNKTHGKLPIDYAWCIVEDNDRFNYQDEEILSLLYKTDFNYYEKVNDMTVDDFKFRIGQTLIEFNESNHFNIKGDLLVNALDLLKQLNEKTKDGDNLFMMAMAYNKQQNLGLKQHHFQKLMNKSNTHAITDINKNALMIALQYGYEDIACQLMDQGVNSGLTMNRVNNETNESLQEGLSVMEQAYVQKNEQFIQHCKNNQYNIETIKNIEDLLSNNPKNNKKENAGNNTNIDIQAMDSWEMKQLFMKAKKLENSNDNEKNNQENKVVSLF